MLKKEELSARIEKARNFSLAIECDPEIETKNVEVSINDDTAEKFGYNTLGLDENSEMFQKYNKDRVKYNGLFLINGNCPVARDLDEAELIASVLMPKKKSLLDVINAKFLTEYQNRIRGILNASQESKKALKTSTLLHASEQLAAGKITQADFNTILAQTL